MTAGFVEQYELTLCEVFAPHIIVGAEINAVAVNSLEQSPFDGVERKPLLTHFTEHTPQLDMFTYQAAIRRNPIPGSLYDVMIRSHVGPLGRSDRRTGIIVFEGSTVVGSYTDPGLSNPPKYSLFVSAAHRGQNIGQACLIAMWKEFPRHDTLLTRTTFNQAAAYTMLAAFPKYIQLCIDAGLPVPQRVRDSLVADRQAIIDRITAAVVKS